MTADKQKEKEPLTLETEEDLRKLEIHLDNQRQMFNARKSVLRMELSRIMESMQKNFQGQRINNLKLAAVKEFKEKDFSLKTLSRRINSIDKNKM
jgi:hypothetical protein